ncbi:hypothetical protein ACIQUG_33735 [Ensifer sp. NPDC090286]|uniref:hypothetical protein n=1 Tax=Ensifer sp. NPDC090286 TaxID=3363991 RepID=UPI00383A68FB
MITPNRSADFLRALSSILAKLAEGLELVGGVQVFARQSSVGRRIDKILVSPLMGEIIPLTDPAHRNGSAKASGECARLPNHLQSWAGVCANGDLAKIALPSLP